MSYVPPEKIEVRGPEKGVKICANASCPDGRLPATRFYFHADQYAPDGLYPICKQCRDRSDQAIKNRKIAKAIVGSEQKLMSMVKSGDFHEMLCDVVSGAETVLKAFGGMEGLAEKLATDYEASPVGTPSRTKLLLGVLSFVAKGMEAQEPVNVSMLGDDELKTRLIEALGDGPRRTTDESEDHPPVGDSESD